MAVLTAAEKRNIARRIYFEFYQGNAGSTPWTKPQWEAAMDAVNNWIDANVAGFGAALVAGAPQFAANSSGRDKTLLFIGVVLARAGAA